MEEAKYFIFKYLTKRKYQNLNNDKVDYTKTYILYLLTKQNSFATGDTISPNDITKEINIKPQALANTLKIMETEGLIRRESNPENRRMTNIYITEKGLLVGKEYCDQELAKITDLINFLGEEDTQELIRLMKKVDDYIQTKTQQSPQQS